jgi:hypothetical protein
MTADSEEMANQDHSADEEDREFEEAMRDLEDGLVGDEEPVIEEDAEEVAGDVEASDAAVVKDIVSEAQLDGRLENLSKEESLLGRKSIAKVCIFSPASHEWSVSFISTNYSFVVLQTRLSTVQQSRKTYFLPVLKLKFRQNS